MIHHYYSGAHRRRIGEVAFLLTDLADLFWWTRAGFGVTESGNDVSQVNDYGSANLPQVQTTGLDKPTLVNNVINGHPVIRYDGTDHFMTAGVASDWKFLHNGDPYTIFEVFQTTDANPDAAMFLLATHSASLTTIGFSLFHDDRSANSRNDIIIHLITKGSSPAVIFTLTSDNAFPAQTFGILEMTYERGIPGDDSSVYVDGALKGSIDETNTPVTGDPLGALHIGSSVLDDFLFKGDIAETIIYKRALPDAERLQVRNYLKTKFATP